MDNIAQNPDTIYDLLRFNFTVEFTSDDNRGDKYYSKQQREVVNNFGLIAAPTLEDQIKKAISYIIQAHTTDKSDFD